MPQLTSKIDFFESLKLDASYKNTVLFNSYADRDAVFDGRIYKSLDNQSYVRRDKGYIRCSLSMNEAKTITYLRFYNPNYEGRYVYCFVTSQEYVNDGTTDIRFEVDRFMTYCGSLNVLQCYVEREHSTTDVTGSHTLGEPVPFGNLVSVSSDDTVSYQILGNTDRKSKQVVILTTYNAGGEFKPGQLRDNVYGGTFLKVFPVNTTEEVKALNDWLEKIVNANLIDSIIGAYQLSGCFLVSESDTFDNTENRLAIKMKSNFGTGQLPCGYTPKNKKLYCYPYNYLEVSDGSNKGEYRWEYFNDISNGEVSSYFVLFANVTNGMPAFSLVPYDYKGGYDEPQVKDWGGTAKSGLFDERVDMNLYTPVSFNVDSFKAWLAQNMGGAVPALNMVGTLATGVASGNVLGTGLTLGNQLLNFAQEKIKPPTSKGQANGNVMAMTNHLLPFFISKSVNYDTARMIDDFFTVYGYQTNRVKVPNINKRPHWNYVKTANANLSGNIPKSDLDIMTNAFNNGITFWRNITEIGDYSLDNTV